MSVFFCRIIPARQYRDPCLECVGQRITTYSRFFSFFFLVSFQQQKQEQRAAFESQIQEEELTLAEQEELAVRKRREEGTPCTKENFETWKAAFEAEMEASAVTDDEIDGPGKSSNKKAKSGSDDKAGRITGYQYFKNTANNLEALEAAAEAAEQQEIIDEELFEDDVDLDDLDFDDDDDEDEEEDDDDDDEEVDI